MSFITTKGFSLCWFSGKWNQYESSQTFNSQVFSMENAGKSQGTKIDIRQGIVWEKEREGRRQGERERLFHINTFHSQEWLYLDISDEATKLNRTCRIAPDSVSSRMFQGSTSCCRGCSWHCMLSPNGIGSGISQTTECSSAGGLV